MEEMGYQLYNLPPKKYIGNILFSLNPKDPLFQHKINQRVIPLKEEFFKKILQENLENEKEINLIRAFQKNSS